MSSAPTPSADAAEAYGLGDFTTTPRAITISGFAIVIGAISAVVALALLRLIGLFTNLFYFGRWSTALVAPTDQVLGHLVIVVPILGAFIIGLMARYGSDRIRGHGIPEAIEAILINGSRVDPLVAILKPLSSAISIGSGGPFGAEGPIIMTGGAFGSLIAQFFKLTSTERKTLLVAGAAAGMSATFAAPVAAVLLAVEVLLFEWKPRSMIPVALASATAAALRRYLIGVGPLFPVPSHPILIGPDALLGCVVAGLLAGGLSILVTLAVYTAEDGFHHLPFHWMWWPILGGLVIGIGGLIFPQALGVGYDTIRDMLQGDVAPKVILGVLIVKSIIWSVSLGSGTSGGVLAPLLMMGGALGGLEGWFLPHEGAGFWPLLSMGAVLGGTMRAPFTGVIFAVELTHDVNMMLPLVIAVTISHFVTVLVMKRSILTEKVARRGYHLSCEYAIDPLELLFVRDVMRTDLVTVSVDDRGEAPLETLAKALTPVPGRRAQRLYPVTDHTGQVTGVVTRTSLQQLVHAPAGGAGLAGATQRPRVAYPDEPLRVVVYRMAGLVLTQFPVVARGKYARLLGLVSLGDLLKARARNLEAEDRRERVLTFWPDHELPGDAGPPAGPSSAG